MITSSTAAKYAMAINGTGRQSAMRLVRVASIECRRRR
jgi:hypothetical protein